MNAYALAQQAYAATGAPTKSARSIEYELLARISARIRRAVSRNDYPRLLEALHENGVFWRTLAVDVADADNALPATLRARIFYLSEFTTIYTRRVIRERVTVAPLLEVNMAILRGLQSEGTPG